MSPHRGAATGEVLHPDAIDGTHLPPASVVDTTVVPEHIPPRYDPGAPAWNPRRADIFAAGALPPGAPETALHAMQLRQTCEAVAADTKATADTVSGEIKPAMLAACDDLAEQVRTLHASRIYALGTDQEVTQWLDGLKAPADTDSSITEQPRPRLTIRGLCAGLIVLQDAYGTYCLGLSAELAADEAARSKVKNQLEQTREALVATEKNLQSSQTKEPDVYHKAYEASIKLAKAGNETERQELLIQQEQGNLALQNTLNLMLESERLYNEIQRLEAERTAMDLRQTSLPATLERIQQVVLGVDQTNRLARLQEIIGSLSNEAKALANIMLNTPHDKEGLHDTTLPNLPSHLPIQQLDILKTADAIGALAREMQQSMAEVLGLVGSSFNPRDRFIAILQQPYDQGPLDTPMRRSLLAAWQQLKELRDGDGQVHDGQNPHPSYPAAYDSATGTIETVRSEWQRRFHTDLGELAAMCTVLTGHGIRAQHGAVTLDRLVAESAQQRDRRYWTVFDISQVAKALTDAARTDQETGNQLTTTLETLRSAKTALAAKTTELQTDAAQLQADFVSGNFPYPLGSKEMDDLMTQQEQLGGDFTDERYLGSDPAYTEILNIYAQLLSAHKTLEDFREGLKGFTKEKEIELAQHQAEQRMADVELARLLAETARQRKDLEALYQKTTVIAGRLETIRSQYGLPPLTGQQDDGTSDTAVSGSTMVSPGELPIDAPEQPPTSIHIHPGPGTVTDGVRVALKSLFGGNGSRRADT